MTQYILKDSNKSKLIVAALWFVYAASYFIRTCYAASIAPIVDEGVFSKGEIGLIGTAFFICYGIGQLISGLIGDRVNPFSMIVFGSLAGAASCFAMSLADRLIFMLIIWALNGFFQSMLWSPILRIFSETINKNLRHKAILNISLSLPIGTICAYLVSTVIIKFYEWKIIFVCGGICIFVASVFVILAVFYVKSYITKVKIQNSEKKDKPNCANDKASFLYLAMRSGLFIIIVPSFLHGMMRDGITNWVPTMIAETYGVSASFSVFLTVILPVMNAFGAYVVVPLYKKLGENEMKTAGVTGLFALVPMVLLLFIGKLPIYIIIILLAVTTSVMYALNYLIISLVPIHFSGCSRTSSVSGILNSAAHIGCAVSSYGFGAVAEHSGWNAVIIIWIVSAILIFISSLLTDKKWRKFVCK